MLDLKFGSDGGAMLIVPPGKWLTGSFNLTSNFTLFLQKGAVILGSQIYSDLKSSFFCTFFPFTIVMLLNTLVNPGTNK